MPRRRKDYSPYRRPDSPFWWLYFGIDGTREPTEIPNDERHREEAEREGLARAAKKAAALGAGAERAGAPAAQVTLQRAVADYTDHERQTYKGQDERHLDSVELHLAYVLALAREPAFPWTTPASITSKGWESAWHQLHHSGGGPLRWQSISRVTSTLRKFLRWCESGGIVAVVPELKAPPAKWQRQEAQQRRAMDLDERERFLWGLALLGEERALLIYTVLLFTALRKGELEALTPRWVDFARGVVRVPARDDKAGHHEVIPLHPRAEEALRAALAEQHPVRLDEPLFGSFDFHWSNTYRGPGVFQRACEMAAIDLHGLTPHHFARHTAADLAAAAGANAKELLAMGRWSNLSMVERYTHPSTEDARRALARL